MFYCMFYFTCDRFLSGCHNTQRRNAERGIAMGSLYVCLSVRPSVCLSVCDVEVVYRGHTVMSFNCLCA